MVKVYKIEDVSYKNDIDFKKQYFDKYGYHFNDKLCEFAVSRMKIKDDSGRKVPVTPYEKDSVERLLRTYNIKIDNDKHYDKVFVANMGKADYLNSSVPDEQHLGKYIKDVLDDPDGYEGIAFVRWLADIKHNHIKIDWESML